MDFGDSSACSWGLEVTWLEICGSALDVVWFDFIVCVSIVFVMLWGGL